MKRSGFTTALAVLLSGCTTTNDGDHGYPSLAKRAIESAPEDQSMPVQPVPAPAADAEKLMVRIIEIEAQAKRGDAAFDTLYQNVAAQISNSRGSAILSEEWVVAQVNLARLEQARHDSVYALADLDRICSDMMADIADGNAAGGLIDAQGARSRVLVMVDGQNGRMNALRALLKEP